MLYFLADRGDFLEGEDGDIRVAQRLAVEDLGVGADGLLEVARVGRIDEGHVDADAREGVVELVVGAAVQPAGGDDVIAGAAQGQDRLGLGGVPDAGGQRADAAFQVGQALLEHIGGRVHDAGVDVAELLQGEQVGGVLGALELVAGGLVDRHGAAAGGRVGLLAGVQLAGVEAKLAICAHLLDRSFLLSGLLDGQSARSANSGVLR